MKEYIGIKFLTKIQQKIQRSSDKNPGGATKKEARYNLRNDIKSKKVKYEIQPPKESPQVSIQEKK